MKQDWFWSAFLFLIGSIATLWMAMLTRPLWNWWFGW